MKMSFHVDTGNLEEKLYLLAKAARVAPGVVIKEETKGICRQIMKLTPPGTQAQGRRAIQGDISRIVWAPEPETLYEGPIKWALKKGDAARVAALVARKGKTFVASTGPIQAQHLKMRTKYGRVNKGVKPFLAAFANVAKGYVREVQSRVGWAKGAWARTLIAAGGTVPSWIGRHAAAAGRVIANFGENPSVTAIANDVKIPRYQQLVDTAVATRVRITQRKIDRIVAGKAVNLGFMTIEGR